MEQKILDLLNNKKVAFFIGAGVSMIPPSCLPSWWQVNHIILDSLTNLSNSITPNVGELTTLIKNREEDGKLPPEFAAEIICNRIGDSYFKVLEGLEGDTPNQVHLWLAILAKIGKLKVIITTNFDTLIEKAFRIINIPLKVCVDPKDYERVYDLLNNSVNEETPCILLKLHGTATHPETCIDTLAQRKRGLDPKIVKTLNLIGYQNFWIFLGYSGADLEAEPNYLGLRKRMENSPGFAWLHLSNIEPLKSVSELVELYGKDRGIIDFGTLPNWLNDIKRLLPDFISPPNDLDMTQEQLNEIKEGKLKKIRNHSKSWAIERGEISSTLILSDIGIEAGAYEAAKLVLVDLINNRENHQIGSRNLAIIYLELGKILKHFGDNKEALSYYQKSSDLFKNIDDLDGYLTTVHEISRMQHHFGEFLKAEKNMEKVVQIMRKNSDNEGLISSLNDLGSFYNNTGKFQEALDIYNESISLSVQFGYESWLAQASLGIAITESEMGDLISAENNIEKAIKIFSRLGDNSFLSEALRNLAEINFDKGENELAFKYLEEARNKAFLVGDKSRMVRVELMKADFMIQNGNYAEAISILTKINKIIEILEDALLTVDIWEKMGIATQLQGDLNQAINIYKNALIEVNRIGLEARAANIQNNLGIILDQQGTHEEALNFYAKAYNKYKEIGQIKAMSNTTANIANVYYRLGKFDISLDYYNEALGYFKELNDIGAILNTKTNLANIKVQLGEYKNAVGIYNQTIQMAEQYGKLGLRDITKLNLAGIYFQQEEYPKAIELYIQIKNTSIERNDFYYAGMGSYYLGLGLGRMNELDKAKEAITDAINLWDKMKEPCPMINDAQKILDSLNNI